MRETDGHMMIDLYGGTVNIKKAQSLNNRNETDV